MRHAGGYTYELDEGGAHELRVAIAGAGFIGAVHARVRAARGRAPRRRRRLLAGARGGRGRSSAPSARSSRPRRWSSRRDVDVVHICTPNHLHVPLAEAALAAGKHVICEKPIAIDAAGAEQLTERPRRRAARGGAVRLPLLPHGPRGARARAQRATGAVRLIHGTYLQDWLLRPDDDNWRVEEDLGGASRAFADIGSHWCDLAEFVSGHRIARLSRAR